MLNVGVNNIAYIFRLFALLVLVVVVVVVVVFIILIFDSIRFDTTRVQICI